MTPQDGPLGLRRAGALFVWVAWAGVPLVLVVGVLMLTRPADADRAEVSIRERVAAGEPLDLGGTASARLLWGEPVTVDLTDVTCTGTGASGPVALPVETSPTTATEAGGSTELVRLARVETMPYVADVTCSGGGLTVVGDSAAGSPAGVTRGFGVFLLLMAPVLVVLGLVARRLTRRPGV